MYSGGCLCGAVRLECAGAPLIVRQCWCRTCQYLAAGNASVNAIFRDSDLTISGPLRQYESLADSGNHIIRSFCERCGTPLLCSARESPGFVVVRVGAFDDTEPFKPTLTIWARSAPSWACHDPAIECLAQAAQPVG